MLLIDNDNNFFESKKFHYLEATFKKYSARVIYSLEITDAKIIVSSLLDVTFSLPNIHKDTNISLQTFLDKFQEHYRLVNCRKVR